MNVTATSIASGGTGGLGIGASITFTLTTDNPVKASGVRDLTTGNGAPATCATRCSDGERS